jgi:hypothetical protein
MQENQSGSPFPFLEGERRKEDRRQNDRQGKYDRRKNRCVHCLYFQEPAYCQKHNTAMAADAFACPQFSGRG